MGHLNFNTPPGAKLGLCRSTIYSKFFIGGPSNFPNFLKFSKFTQIFQIVSNFPLHTSVWLGLRSGAAKVRQSRCVRPPESSSSSSTQYRIEIVLWNWFCSRLDLRPRQKQNGKKDKYTNTKTNTLHCALCSRLTRERLLSDRPCCKIKTILFEISNERFGCSTGWNTNTVGVLNGK